MSFYIWWDEIGRIVCNNTKPIEVGKFCYDRGVEEERKRCFRILKKYDDRESDGEGLVSKIILEVDV